MTRKEDVQEVEAEVIDTPTISTDADRWLARAASEAERIASEYRPHEITSGKDYRESKSARAQARKEMAAIDAERKSMTKDIEATIKRFRDGAKEALAPLTDIDASYKREIDAWESHVIDTRRAEMREEYEDGAPDIALPQGDDDAALVPFDRLWDAYAATEKWGNVGTNDERAKARMWEIVRGIAERERRIDAMPYGDADKVSLKAEFFATLDLDSALAHVQDAIAQRERMEALEAERREREAEAERQSAAAADSQGDEPGQGRADREEPRQVLVFEVTVPPSALNQFVNAMRSVEGVHGRKVGVRNV